jgi:threonine synthase
MNLCPDCSAPLLVEYEFHETAVAARALRHVALRDVLPSIPRRRSSRSAKGHAAAPLDAPPNVWIKDESKNPTRSFKSRGMAVAVTMARQARRAQPGRADRRQRRRRAFRVRRARRTAGVRGHAARHAAVDRR